MTHSTPAPAHYVYRAFTYEGQCLYVGCTNQPKNRPVGHLLNSPWYWEAADWEWTGPLDEITAADMERREIWRLNPTHNEIRSNHLRDFFAAWDGPSAKALTARDLALLGATASDVDVLTTLNTVDARYIVADSELARLRDLKDQVAA